MAKLKKEPVLPIYAIAVVWALYTLVHPLYQVSDYVSVILISVVVFIVAKGLFPTIEDGPALPPELVHHAQEAKPEQATPAQQETPGRQTDSTQTIPETENTEKEEQAETEQTAPQEPSPEEETDSRD